MEHTSADGSFGFSINDDAPLALQLQMRAQVYGEQFADLFERIDDDAETFENVVATSAELKAALDEIVVVREDLLTMFKKAYAENPDEADGNDLVEALTHMDTVLVALLMIIPTDAATVQH